MRRVIFQMMVSLDGYYEAPGQDISWHTVDDEFNTYAVQMLDSAGLLLFGRITYELMAGFWPTAYTMETDPLVAGRMNALPKIVFSTTLQKAEWNNTRLVKENAAAELQKLKQQPGKDIFILGSSHLAMTFMEAGLIDEFRIFISPTVLGAGKSLFEGLPEKMQLKLKDSQVFANGNVLLYYAPL